MNRISKVGLFAALALSLSACSGVKPDAGHEAVLIKKPLFFGHGGVHQEPVKTGLSWVALTTSSIPVDMRPREYSVPFDDLMSKDGVPLHFEAALRVQVVDSVQLIEKFGENWLTHNLEAEVRNRVRQSVRKYGMNEIAIDANSVDAVDAEVTKAVEAYIKSAGLPVRLIKFTIGKVNPPDAVKTQRVRSADEEQRRLTEEQTRQAELARKLSEEARADADNAYRQRMSLSPEQFVKLEEIKMMEKVCAGGGCTFINGNGAALVSAR